MDRTTKEINEQKLKLSKEEEQVAKAKELLAAMRFDEQLSKLQVYPRHSTLITPLVTPSVKPVMS